MGTEEMRGDCSAIRPQPCFVDVLIQQLVREPCILVEDGQ